MKKHIWLTILVTSSVVLFGASALADSALTIEGDSSGASVTYDNASGAYPVVTAILSTPQTLDGYTYTRYVFLAQDSTGSLDIFGAANDSSYIPTVGDVVSITGTYSPFDGIPEVASPSTTVISQGSGIGSPSVYTVNQIVTDVGASTSLPNNLGEYLVTLDNVTLYTSSALTTVASGSFPTHANMDLWADDGTGGSIDVFVWASSYSVDGALGGTAIPTSPVDITGFLSISSGTLQITPTSIAAVPEPATLSLCGAGALLALAFRRRKS
jgi:PEP-CTERM motif